MAASDSPCDFHCGYYGTGDDLHDHVFNEHQPCPDCGAGPGQDLRTYSLSHKQGCVRLQPGYVYPHRRGSNG